ncbi:MAG TPA: Re/Si-specific NAD(P)(+) transhydrogenase subunit alpha [Bacteroidales bacterium]|nr:Re/Si-specific NAD(P)(+) transhydrogenase subunit alpha [Bacteroidales bacterium]HOK74376.1 Re/Si-specific NAD(P)(+) transhydrogenase subunit alpha [Bacteroidales bacterium]HOM41772.1 Re/Si-specific NAD(P)(+) transhydrogenase subunit alpha [Bacteroidales bacterium]HPP92088.1 Re/Si-specific NAD(P)(+) transhydrogenase subunit alpha [Bacteroidales bacterium]HRT47137.1 Re/Si-specific NAD(P)(+) transhydrogenase subunit alpha [Bacteroidales bacterium]
MIIGILKEKNNENRVAMLPGEVQAVRKLGIEVMVERGAGERAFAFDGDYVSAGATAGDRNEIIGKSDLLVSVNPPIDDKITDFKNGQILCCIVNPVENREWLEKARVQGLTVFALDLIPRTTRAQAMDILSSMATVAGYKAVIHAASLLPKFFPMFMSAAGTIKPAKVLVLGAGVAGLQALAIARKLGAVVEVFDVRAAVKDEVKSLGGKFIEVEGAVEDASAGGYAVEQTEEYKRKQQEMIQKHAAAADVIIATAQIPGKRAPVLILKDTVMKMKPGSVIIDLAASTGGNCELTQNGKMIEVNGVKIIGKSDYPSDMPTDASKMFGANIVNLLKILVDREGKPVLDFSDEIVTGTTAVHGGQYISQRIKQLLNLQ